MTELWERDAWELANEVRSGEVSSVELLDLFLARIERFDPELNAFCFIDVEGARRRATEIDTARRGRRRPRALGGCTDGDQGARAGRRVSRHARIAVVPRPDRAP